MKRIHCEKLSCFKTGDLDPKVSVFAVQGDRYWKGDKLFVHTDNTWKEVTDKLNPTGNIFNSTISEYEEHMRDKYPGTFNPDYKIIWELMQI